MSTAAVRRYTVEEYLVLERDSETKHEFYDGEIFAMAGASKPHSLVAGNVYAALHAAVRDRDCYAYPSDMRIVCPTGLFAYPDASVACDSEDVEVIRGLDTLKNPLIIVEVLSKSTEAYDLGNKFDHYRAIPSLRGYLLLRQDRPRAYYYRRQDDGNWLLTSADGLDANIALPELDLSLSLADLYAKVEFPPAEELDRFVPDATPPESHPAGPRIL